MVYVSIDLDEFREQHVNSSSKQPFQHQIEAFEKLSKTFADSKEKPGSGILVLPTGAGKTFTAVRWLSDHVVPKNIKILWLAPSFYLLDQAFSAFYSDYQAGAIQSGIAFYWSVIVDMQPYSLDLRQKVFDAYQAGGISQRRLAQNFGVSLSFVQDLLKQYRERHTLAPKVRTQQTPTQLNAPQLDLLRQLVEEQPDATLGELRERLHQKTGIGVGTATVDRMLRLKLKLTVKKKSSAYEKSHRRGSTGAI